MRAGGGRQQDGTRYVWVNRTNDCLCLARGTKRYVYVRIWASSPAPPRASGKRSKKVECMRHTALAEPATRYYASASYLQPHCGVSGASQSTTMASRPLLQRARRFASSRPVCPQRRCRSRASPIPAKLNGPEEAPRVPRVYREGRETSFGCGSSLRWASTVGSRTRKSHQSLSVG